MNSALKQIYGHLKFIQANGLKFRSRRSIVDPDIFVVEYTDPSLKFHAFSVTLHPVEHFERMKSSKIRMERIEVLKNAKK